MTELYICSIIFKHCKYKSLGERSCWLTSWVACCGTWGFIWGLPWTNAWGVCFLHFLLWPYTLLRSPCPSFTTVPPYVVKDLILLYYKLYEFYSVFTFSKWYVHYNVCLWEMMKWRVLFFSLLETFQTLWFSELFSWERLYTWNNSMWISLYSPLCFSEVSS